MRIFVPGQAAGRMVRIVRHPGEDDRGDNAGDVQAGGERLPRGAADDLFARTTAGRLPGPARRSI
jgi:hypothetical protein